MLETAHGTWFPSNPWLQRVSAFSIQGTKVSCRICLQGGWAPDKLDRENIWNHYDTLNVKRISFATPSILGTRGKTRPIQTHGLFEPREYHRQTRPEKFEPQIEKQIIASEVTLDYKSSECRNVQGMLERNMGAGDTEGARSSATRTCRSGDKSRLMMRTKKHYMEFEFAQSIICWIAIQCCTTCWAALQ
jgi:hypothetical protein